jgi:hemoglobin
MAEPATASAAPALVDLATRSAVHDVVVAFYREVVVDELLAPIFDEVAEVDWASHLPRLVDYWCWILLGHGGSGGQVMSVHRQLHAAEPIRAEHCDRWYELWVRSVDERSSGPLADRAKAHAASLMGSMAKHLFGVVWTPPR